MKLVPLAQLGSQLRVGQPLPWSVRDGQGGLLLARGNLVIDEAMVESLLTRGAFVDAEEAKAARGEHGHQPAEKLIGRWQLVLKKLSLALRAPQEAGFAQRIHEGASEIAALTRLEPDLAIAHVVHPELCAEASYSIAHALHAAIAASLLGQRQGWAEPEVLRLNSAALTMNLGMLALQDRLATQDGPPNALQRQTIRQHPAKSAAMLREAGVTDPAWLAIVEQHHEQAGGAGYPEGATAPCELSQWLRVIDLYTAKFARRAKRSPLHGDHAARELFSSSRGDAAALHLVKAFGLYPPGTLVRLASGEIAMAVRRGSTGNTPQVASLVSRSGEARQPPLKRDTAQREHAVAGCVAPSELKVRIPWAQVYDA